LNDLKQHRDSDRIFLYIYLSSDPSEDNPMSNIRYDLKDTEARNLVFGTTKLRDVFSDEDIFKIVAAQRAYVKEYTSEYQHDMMSYDKKLDQLNSVLKTEVPVIKKNVKASTGEVSFTSNIPIINRILKDVISIVTTKTRLMEVYLNGSSAKFKRGVEKGGVSPLSGGKLNI
jgi:hypothetical protein